MWTYNYSNELMHYGIPGMKWGHRKAYPTGRAYDKMRNAKTAYKTSKKESDKAYRKMYNLAADHPIATNFTKKGKAKYEKAVDDYYKADKNRRNKRGEYIDAKKEYKQTDEYKAKRAKAIKIGAAAAGTALAVYGGHKASQYLKSEACRKATRAGEEHLRRNINTGKFLKGMNLSKINSKEWGKKVNRDLSRDVDLVNKVSNSTREAAKYLYSTRKRR